MSYSLCVILLLNSNLKSDCVRVWAVWVRCLEMHVTEGQGLGSPPAPQLRGVGTHPPALTHNSGISALLPQDDGTPPLMVCLTASDNTITLHEEKTPGEAPFPTHVIGRVN